METLRDLGREYEQRFAALEPYREAVWKVLTSDCFQRYIAPNSAILDLGAGWGEFIRNISAERKLAMDMNPDTARFLNPQVRFLQQSCCEPWPVSANTLDLIFTSNFFEHLPDKDSLRRTLQEAHRCLKPGGRIICIGPNIRFLPGTYWDFWDHFLPLTDRSLVEGLRLCGFAIERVEPKFLPYSMSQGWTPPIACLRLYLRLPVLWHWFGKQFFVVARRP